ncbi:MAG TPA: hypothetical protein VEH84_07565 [Alphaproteobacteria bacterium]|nr:hypothetical protein [Alphaproteobacteria bacterium]
MASHPVPVTRYDDIGERRGLVVILDVQKFDREQDIVQCLCSVATIAPEPGAEPPELVSRGLKGSMNFAVGFAQTVANVYGAEAVAIRGI